MSTSVPDVAADLSAGLQKILHAQEMRGERTTNKIRLIFALFSALGLLSLLSVNTPKANLIFSAQVSLWLLFGVLVHLFLKRLGDGYAGRLKYATITADLLFLSLGALAMSQNHSGILEYWRGYVPLVFVFWNLLSGLRLSFRACLYSAGLTLLINGLLLLYSISSGAIEVSDISVYDRNAVNIGDQVFQILFIAIPGLIAGGLTRISRRLILRAEQESHRRNRLEREKERLGKYLSRDLVELVVARSEELTLGGSRCEATVLFTDIRNFTPISERVPPEQAVAMLNDYFTRMVRIVFRYGGTLDKFLGDGMMVVFGAPLKVTEAPARAVGVALEMARVAETFNQELAERGFPEEVRIGIGIATGTVVAGNIGSPERMDYTCIGDTVNFASRLESANKEQATRVLICEETWAALGGRVVGRQLDAFHLKGKLKAVRPYAIDPDAVSDAQLEGYRQALLKA